MSNQCFFLFHMEPKITGIERSPIHAISVDPDSFEKGFGIDQYRELHPEQFEQDGHYSLLVSVDSKSITHEKKK